MKKIIKIWFEENWLMGEGDDGKIYRQSVLWYPKLSFASAGEREQYEFGFDGIHWRGLDVDVSFESFEYPDKEPGKMQSFFLTHPEINVSGFARRVGINPGLLRNYINGFKQPSREREEEIMAGIRHLGLELSNV